MAYVTLAEWKQYRTQLSGAAQSRYSAQEDAVLQLFIDEAQAEIEAQTGKRFEALVATRYFRACDRQYTNARLLILDDWLLSVTSIANGDALATAIAPADYWLYPYNGPPYSAIELKTAAAWSFAADGRIAINGSWGYMAVADARVKRVTFRLAEFFWQKRSSTGESQNLGDGQIILAAEYPKDVLAFISGHRVREVG